MSLMSGLIPTHTDSLLCGELARKAARMLEDPAKAHSDTVSLQNIYRLLEMYRFDTFFDISPKGVLELGEPEDAVSAMPMPEDGRSLKEALDAARDSVYPGTDKQQVVESLEGLIRELAHESKVASGPDRQDISQARKFFDKLAQALKAA